VSEAPAPRVLGRYDGPALRVLFDEAGVLATLARKGFADLEVTVESAWGTQPHARLFGRKGSRRCLLLDAILAEAVVRPELFTPSGYAMARPLALAVVYWLREQDPTAAFSAARPPLPLQQHPGLGILRQGFKVIVRMARDLDKDGVASVPKLFHDAAIFYRSRLFLFLDPREQGRLEALVRDLRPLSLGDASLALIGGCVRDADGTPAVWTPSFQVFPLTSILTDYFHAPAYAAEVARARERHRFTWDAEALARTRRLCAPAPAAAATL
jgi:hypothetical protein